MAVSVTMLYSIASEAFETQVLIKLECCTVPVLDTGGSGDVVQPVLYDLRYMMKRLHY